MRIVICWVQWSGYMAACWRALAKRPGVELLVLAEHGMRANGQPVFDPKLIGDLNCRLITTQQMHDADFLLKHVSDFRPQVVALCGWGIPAFRALAMHPSLAHVRFIMGMDTPRKDTLRQRMGKYHLRRFFSRIDRVIVAGERTWQLGRLLGFEESQLRRGFYSIDDQQFEGVLEKRLAMPGWPRRFLYVGRYIPVKAIDVMCEGYRRYRSRVDDPWTFTCCGEGDEGRHITGTPGMEDKGYLQPYDLPAVLADHGAFVITSRYEPWGVVLAEAGYTGLPILCTEACGASLDVVRSFYSGVVVPTDDAEALARGMEWVHAHHAELPEMGRRSRVLAGAYTAPVWAARWESVFRELV